MEISIYEWLMDCLCKIIAKFLRKWPLYFIGCIHIFNITDII